MKLRLLSAAFCALFVLFCSSCREDTIISASVTPSIDNIHTFSLDSVSFSAVNIYDDSALTSLNMTPAYAPLGWFNGDAYSGNIAGSLYMQVVPPSTGLTLTDDPDSGFIVLPYGGFLYGDTAQKSLQTYRAYQIGEFFSKDSLYYSFYQKITDPAVIGVGSLRTTGLTSQVDSVSVKGVNVTPHLRIELTRSFLHYMRTVLDGSQDSSYTSFTNAFRGFYIVPDSSASQPSLPYFRLDQISADPYSQASMVLYKHPTSASDTVTYFFPLSPAYAAHFSRITRNLGPVAQQAFHSTDSTTLLLHNAPGAAIDVTIPNIASLPKNVIINKCELVVTERPEQSYSGRPRSLLPVGIDSAGARYTIVDRYPTTTADGLNFIDGTPRTETVNGTVVTRYHINFPRELQSAIIQGKSKLHLRIGGTANYPAAYRLYAGGTRGQYRMQLHIVYSKQ